jgi:hypothetical protein
LFEQITLWQFYFRQAPSRFRTTTVQANKQTVEAETGWLSQRFAPSEKPKPSPRGHRSTLRNPFSSPRCSEPAVAHSQNFKKN